MLLSSNNGSAKTFYSALKTFNRNLSNVQTFFTQIKAYTYVHSAKYSYNKDIVLYAKELLCSKAEE
jgi:hypothetical protein